MARWLLLWVVISCCWRVTPAQTLETDVCIYGATSAGVIAAYTVAREGRKVILLEPGTHLGGMSSGGLGQTDIGNKHAITGYAREFYKRVGAHYGKAESWTFEPHVASQVFRSFLQEVKVEVRYNSRVASVQKKGDQISTLSVVQADGGRQMIRAKIFLDCTYEGDLMAMAGVTFTVGRESNAQYQETYNGVQLRDKHQFPDGVDPWRTPGDPASGLLWGISPQPMLPDGTGDASVQAYNFRLCLTDDAANRIPITRPADYDSTRYELLLRQLAVYTPDSLNWQLMHIARMPNHKTDINNCGGFSSDMIGASHSYATADWPTRQQIVAEHRAYTRGWLYFIGHDKRVPAHLRAEMLQWGYPRDEYEAYENFTPQLYVREARRMVSDVVMTQHHCQGKIVADDVAGYAAYTMDSHNCRRVVVNGMVKNEGDVQIGGFGPYPISYRAVVPARQQCTNLLVPVCLSASHIAYGSIRMEPVFMVLAQTAGLAAVQAIEKRIPIQQVNLADIRAKAGIPVPLKLPPNSQQE